MRVPEQQFANLLQSIDQYRKKYYQNQLFKGSLLAVALLITLYLLINTVEYFGRFNSVVRGILFFSFLGTLALVLFRWVISPILHLSGISKPLSDEEAARHIGKAFPHVGDKLLNTLQLRKVGAGASDLIEASIQQKSGQLLLVRFTEAVNFKETSKYVRYAAYPVAALAMILLLKPSFLSTSSERLLKFNSTFNHAPFSFVLQNSSLKSFRNEDFTVRVKLEGEALPENVFLVSNGTRFKLNQDAPDLFSYQFKTLQKQVDFHLEAAGFRSDPHRILLIERPSLLSFDVRLDYPSYLGKPSESLSNVGNLTVPEGTRVQWQFKTSSTEGLSVSFEQDSVLALAEQKSNNLFVFNKMLRKSAGYRLTMTNTETPEGQPVDYYINVIPDNHPEIVVENFQDTTHYNYLVVGGSIRDDYGFTQLKLFYNIVREGEEANDPPSTYQSLPIPFNRQANHQSYYFQWYLDSLNLGPGDRLDYYAQVWDNDGVNGAKSSRSRALLFSVPDKRELQQEIAQSVQETQEEIEKALAKAKDLEKELMALEQKLKANKELDFQEKKMAEEILKKRDELIKQIQSLQEKNKIANEKSQQFEPKSEAVQKKMDELQKLMNELLQEESKKLYEELEKALEQKQSERMSKLLERLRNKEKNTGKELERTLNLFKRFQLEQKIESAVEELQELAEKQEELAEKTEDKKEESSPMKNDSAQAEKQEELVKEQEEISERFEEISEKLSDIEKIGEELDQKPDTQKDEQQNARESQKESKQQLKQKENNKASDSQKKSGKSMRKIADAMKTSMESMQSQQMQEDMDSLRDILENLHTLSFDQEQLLKDFRGVSLSDPRFVTLGQKQLKLRDDAKIVEDSLQALANRVVDIQAFITRELNNMNYFMDESVKNIRDRKLSAIPAQQQFAMTSMNNLALMLSNVFAQMQQALASAMMPGSGDKPGEGNSPGQMQQQLNKKMRDAGKAGQGNMSEQLARMAAEQAAIREMVRKMLDAQKGGQFGEQYGKELEKVMEQMEKSETEIVNKRINQELINRNEEMLTRLLESEKAIREQDEDEQRKGETAKRSPRQPPAAFEEYIRSKSQQTELLRTIPPNFTPFYKKQTDSYFQSGASGQ
jgi:hypothetical protein